MVGFPSPFDRGEASDSFDDYDAFVPGHLPAPGPFLDGHRVLVDDRHVAFHRTTRELFEARGVYDVTFGYNLARLNLDGRHPDAGFRYAEDVDDTGTLRAEFTPTTPFCPQAHTLTVGAFRAWNGESDRHAYDLVRVRVAQMHHRSEAIDGVLADAEARFLETGSVEGASDAETETREDTAGGDTGAPVRLGEVDAPF